MQEETTNAKLYINQVKRLQLPMSQHDSSSYTLPFKPRTKISKHNKKVSRTSFQLLDCLHKCMQNIPYKTACTNGLPDDKHTMFETRRRHEELN
jgi:hypothetical protein